MDLKLILVLLMGLIGLGYAIPRVRRDIMEPAAVPIGNTMGVVAIEPSDTDLEESEHRHGGYGGYGGFGGGYGGFGGGYGGYGSGFGGYGGGFGGHGHGHGHHHHHNGHIDFYDY